MNKFLTTFSLTAMMSLSALAGATGPSSSLSEAQKLFWNLNLPQTNQCARESVEPAGAVFMYIDAFAASRGALRLGQKTQVSPAIIVQKIYNELPLGTYLITRDIFEGLTSGKLPLLDGSETSVQIAKRQILNISNATSRAQNPSAAQCLLIKKTIPLQMRSSNIGKKDLENLAVAYLKGDDYIAKCDALASSDMNNTAMLRFDLKNAPVKMSFAFWTSFKIYLSVFWNQSNLSQYGLSYATLLSQYPIQESVVLVPEGCKTLSRPECNAEFLSQNQLGKILSESSLKSASYVLRDMSRNEISSFKNKMNAKDVDDVNYKALLDNWTKLKHQAAYNLYDAQRKMTVIFNQASPEKLVSDLKQSLDTNPHAIQEFESACNEVSVLGSKNVFTLATELSKNQNMIATLKRWPFPGAPLDQSIARTQNVVNSLTALCRENMDRFLDKPASRGSRTWMNSYFKLQLGDVKLVDSMISEDTNYVDAESSYIKVADKTICATPVSCARDLLESYQKIYQVALQQTSLLSKTIVSSSLDRGLGTTVACKIYDPWKESQLRYKKLMLDTASALVSGFTGLPIFLSIDPRIDQVISFQQLADKDQVRLDPVFQDTNWKKTAMLDLGLLAKAPCTIAVSNSQDIKIADPILLFRGISVKACITGKDGEIKQDSIGSKDHKDDGRSACGQCSLNFERVALSQVRGGYSGITAGLRLFAGMLTFFEGGSNPMKTPMELNVNPKYAAAAYKEKNEIDEGCMLELTHGAPCMKNLCVSKTVALFETKFNLDVEKADLNSNIITKQQIVTIKIKGCGETVDVPVTCDSNQVPALMNFSVVKIPNSCGAL